MQNVIAEIAALAREHVEIVHRAWSPSIEGDEDVEYEELSKLREAIRCGSAEAVHNVQYHVESDSVRYAAIQADENVKAGLPWSAIMHRAVADTLGFPLCPRQFDDDFTVLYEAVEALERGDENQGRRKLAEATVSSNPVVKRAADLIASNLEAATARTPEAAGA